MKAIVKELKESFTVVHDVIKPLIRGFWKYSPCKTFTFAILLGVFLSIFFNRFHFLASSLAFLFAIFIFVTIYKRSKDELIKEEIERFEKLCRECQDERIHKV